MAEVKEGGWRALQESGDVGGGVSAFVINVHNSSLIVIDRFTHHVDPGPIACTIRHIY